MDETKDYMFVKDVMFHFITVSIIFIQYVDMDFTRWYKPPRDYISIKMVSYKYKDSCCKKMISSLSYLDDRNSYTWNEGLYIEMAPWPINTLWFSYVIWWYKSGSKLTQIMACYLMAPSHYLNQCWLLIGEVLWHSHGNIFTVIAQATILYDWFGNFSFKI